MPSSASKKLEGGIGYVKSGPSEFGLFSVIVRIGWEDHVAKLGKIINPYSNSA